MASGDRLTAREPAAPFQGVGPPALVRAQRQSVRSGPTPHGRRPGEVLNGPRGGRIMTYEFVAICDACGLRETFRVDAFGPRFVGRPLPRGRTHVHRDGQPGVVTPEIGIACLRALLPKARRNLLARQEGSASAGPEESP